MIDPLVRAMELAELNEAGDTKIQYTHGHAMAAMAFTLSWQSEGVRHRDRLVMPKLNLWCDILPPVLETQLMNKPVGHASVHVFSPGELVPPLQDTDCIRVPGSAFNRHYRKCYVEPRAGRFYPKGFVAGAGGVFIGDLTPFRVAEVRNDELALDVGHPLAGREVELEARILGIRDAGEEHGGACNDVAEAVRFNGPGMQARWRGRPTDFWADLPFMRSDPTADAVFYEKPRMVHHLDDAALEQLARLYEGLIPRNARVLDLMASWTSHLPRELEPASVAGLGMNSAELAANPLLSQRLVHDLNLDPRLPLDDMAFDVAVCTVSVEYLTKPIDVFKEVHRVLRPGGRFIVSFSNRWFPPKVVKVWQDIHEFERMGLVIEYFLRAGFSDVETWSLRGLPRPANDKYAKRMTRSDPVYAVWGVRGA